MDAVFGVFVMLSLGMALLSYLERKARRDLGLPGPEPATLSAPKAEPVILPVDRPLGLLRDAASELDPELRTKLMRTLVADYDGSELGRHTQRAGLSDPDPRVRSLAAVLTHGHPAVALMQLLAAPELDEDLRARVADEILRRPWPDVRGLVGGALDDASVPVRQALLHALGRNGQPELAPVLSRMLPKARRDLRDLLATLDALASSGDASAERELLSLLPESLDAVRVPVLGALGAVGTLAAVEPLLDFARSHTPSVAAAASGAIQAIQGRAGGERGALSIGALELAPGALSVDPASEYAGQLSEPHEDA